MGAGEQHFHRMTLSSGPWLQSQVRGRVPVDWTFRCREQRQSAQEVLSVSRQQVPGSSPGSESIAAVGRSNIAGSHNQAAQAGLFLEIQTFEDAFEFFGIVVGDDQLSLARSEVLNPDTGTQDFTDPVLQAEDVGVRPAGS